MRHSRGVATHILIAHGLYRPSASSARYLRLSAKKGLGVQSSVTFLLLHRNLSTEPHNANAHANTPPPGFDAQQASRPLQPAAATAPAREAKKAVEHEIEPVPKDVATAVPKTAATDALTLSELAGTSEKAMEKKEAKKDKEKNLTLWQKVKKEAAHYRDGTKLLITEVKISTRLALKMAAGYELSRRESRQLSRTTQDIARLVPFSVFVLVPFAELLLPVALKLFPNMLPSTYEGQKSKDAKVSSLRATRKDVSNFLRQTLKESGLPISPAITQKEEFADFFRKVRATGESPTTEDVIKVSKAFRDDLTLDNLSRAQLVGMCKYMNLNTFGTDPMLRYQIRHRMRQIKRDDRAISFEGVETLSVPELQTACLSRGLRTHGMSPGRLRDDLQAWLDLRLKHGIPSTLLVLSNAFMYTQGKESEFSTQIDALTGVLSSIPEELFHEIELEVHNAEGAATNKQRLEVLKEQQELIEEENEQNEEIQETGRAAPRDVENIDEKEEVKHASPEATPTIDASQPEAIEVQESEKHEDKSSKL